MGHRSPGCSRHSAGSNRAVRPRLPCRRPSSSSTRSGSKPRVASGAGSPRPRACAPTTRRGGHGTPRPAQRAIRRSAVYAASAGCVSPPERPTPSSRQARRAKSPAQIKTTSARKPCRPLIQPPSFSRVAQKRELCHREDEERDRRPDEVPLPPPRPDAPDHDRELAEVDERRAGPVRVERAVACAADVSADRERLHQDGGDAENAADKHDPERDATHSGGSLGGASQDVNDTSDRHTAARW